MSAIYFEDVIINRRLVSQKYNLSAKNIIHFAQQWDPQPYHTDAELAKKYPLQKLFASGTHLIAICSKLANSSAPQTQALAGLGWDTLRFTTPGYAGDTLLCENWAIEKRLSKSKPNMGIVTYQMRLRNQHQEELLSYTVTCLMRCKNSTTQK